MYHEVLVAVGKRSLWEILNIGGDIRGHRVHAIGDVFDESVGIPDRRPRRVT